MMIQKRQKKEKQNSIKKENLWKIVKQILHFRNQGIKKILKCNRYIRKVVNHKNPGKKIKNKKARQQKNPVKQLESKKEIPRKSSKPVPRKASTSLKKY